MKPKPDTLQSIMQDLQVCHTPEIKNKKTSKPPFIPLKNFRGKRGDLFSCEYLINKTNKKQNNHTKNFAMFVPRHSDSSLLWCSQACGWQGVVGVRYSWVNAAAAVHNEQGLYGCWVSSALQKPFLSSRRLGWGEPGQVPYLSCAPGMVSL